jgi:hypothetical protein
LAVVRLLIRRYEKAESAVMMISITELLIMGPLCIFLYYAYHRNKYWKAPLELVVLFLNMRTLSGPSWLHQMTCSPLSLLSLSLSCLCVA